MTASRNTQGAAPDAVVVVQKAREPTAIVDADTVVFSADSGRLASFCQNAEHAPFIQRYTVKVWRDYKRRVRSEEATRGTGSLAAHERADAH
jgi:hypothetical protein